MKNIIYTRELFPPYLTLNFQEETCKIVAKMKKIENISVIQDNRNESVNLKKIIENIEDYKYIIIYNFGSLGTTIDEILYSIKKILDNNVKLISIMDPVNLENFGSNPAENMFLTLAIGSAIHTNEKWKEILEFKKD
jgi:DNA invertase Pin-like site-specific DNA recombinase